MGRVDVRGIVVRFPAGAQEIHLISKSRLSLADCALFWSTTQQVMAIPCRRFGTTYLIPPSRVKNMALPPEGSPETSVRNCHYLMRNGPEECSSHLLRSDSLKTHLNLVPSLRMSEVVITSTGLPDSPSLRFNGHQELKQAADHSLPLLPKLIMSGDISPFLHMSSYRLE